MEISHILGVNLSPIFSKFILITYIGIRGVTLHPKAFRGSDPPPHPPEPKVRHPPGKIVKNGIYTIPFRPLWQTILPSTPKNTDTLFPQARSTPLPSRSDHVCYYEHLAKEHYFQLHLVKLGPCIQAICGLNYQQTKIRRKI